MDVYGHLFFSGFTWIMIFFRGHPASSKSLFQDQEPLRITDSDGSLAPKAECELAGEKVGHGCSMLQQEGNKRVLRFPW